MTIENDGNSTWSRSPVYSFQKGINRYNEYNDPTYLGFVFMFDYVNSPLLKSGVGGAIDYLKRTGETLRATYLQTFIDTLQTININMPWYWQSFEGAENLWKYGGFKDPYKGGDDSIITISCLESIDLKMTMLIDLYRKAVYDQQYKRIILPENLRKFEMYIYIQEIRKFHIKKFIELKNPVSTPASTNAANPDNGQIKDSELYKNQNTPYILWLLKYCEFDPDASAVPFTGLNNMGDSSGFAKQSITIKYELVEEPGNFYPSFDGTISSTEPTKAVNNDKSSEAEGGEGSPEKDTRSKLQKKYDSSKQRVTEQSTSLSAQAEKKAQNSFETAQAAGLNKAQGVKGSALNAAEDRANALIESKKKATKSLLLDNVYGIKESDIKSGADALNAAQNGSIQSLNPNLIKNASLNDLGNILNENSSTINRAKDSSVGRSLGNIIERNSSKIEGTKNDLGNVF